MRLYFTTILDFNYWGRLKALYHSIKKHHQHFTLFVVCLDDKLQNHLMVDELEDVVVVPVVDVEEFYPELKVLKKERSVIDYIFTLSPYYPSYILEKNPKLPFICSLDVDQYFFSNSEVIFKSLEKHSILITPHRFPPRLESFKSHGTYNVSFQVFKNDVYGIECLQLWRKQCAEWCSDVLSEGKFADQKYLDSWQQIFGMRVGRIDHVGLGLAPWNVDQYDITYQNKVVFVNHEKLILFHYQGLRFVTNNLINSGLSLYGSKGSKNFVRFILTPVVLRLAKCLASHDNISRVQYEAGGKFLRKINYLGMYLLIGNQLLGMDKIYNLKKIKYRINGFFNRLKDIH